MQVLLPITFVPTFYNVDLKVDVEKGLFEGSCAMDLVPGSMNVNSIKRRPYKTVEQMEHFKRNKDKKKRKQLILFFI